MSLIQLTNSTSWTLDSGLSATGDVISLSRLDDRFNNSSLDSTNFGTVLAANGTGVETNVFTINSAAATDAIILYNKNALNTATDKSYITDTMSHNLAAAGSFPMLAIMQRASAPIVGASGTVVPLSLIQVNINQAGNFAIFYWDNAGNPFSWDGAAWQPAFGATVGTALQYRNYKTSIISDGTNWQVVIYDLDAATTITTTTAKAWAATRSDGTSKWLYCGDPYTNAWSGTQCVMRYRETFPATAQQATMGAINVGKKIEQIPITETKETGTAITWDYDIGAGFVTGLTLAQLQTALVNTTPATLNLRANVSSDTTRDATASFDINGGILSGYSLVGGGARSYDIKNKRTVELK